MGARRLSAGLVIVVVAAGTMAVAASGASPGEAGPPRVHSTRQVAVAGTQTLLAPLEVSSVSAAADAAGNVYLGDLWRDRVVKVSPAGVRTAIASTNGSLAGAATIDSHGNLFVLTALVNQVLEFPAGGGKVVLAFPDLTIGESIAVDAQGDVFVGDYNHQVLELPANGTEVVLGFSGLGNVNAVAVDANGDVFDADSDHNRIVELPKVGAQVTLGFSGLSAPYGVAVDASGNVYASDTGNHRVVELPKVGAQTTLALAGLDTPGQLSFGLDATLYVPDQAKPQVFEVPPSGPQQLLDTSGVGTPQALWVDPTGTSYVAGSELQRGTANAIDRVDAVAPGGARTALGFTGLGTPGGITADGAGTVYLADAGNHRVLKLPQGGAPSTIAFTGLSDPQGVAVDPAGDLFVADAANNQVVELPATGPQKTLGFSGLLEPEGLVVDTAGDVFVADAGHNRVVELSKAGTQSVVGFTGLSSPRGLALAGSTLFVADYANHRVVSLQGTTQSTVPFSGLVAPTGVGLDAAGNVFVADAALGLLRLAAPSTVSVTGGTVVRPASGSAPLTFTIALGAASSHDVTVHYQATDGTAIGLVDYTPTSGVATIPAGQLSTTVAVPILGNQSDEPDKTFTLNLSSPTDAVIGAGSAVGTIGANHLLAGCPASPSQVQRFVCHLYWDALDRAAESGGFNYWVNLLGTGTPRLTMATSYLRTPEARNVLVDRLYVFFLGRHSDAAGGTYWANKLVTGATPDDLRIFLATSGEFWTDAGGTNTGFVTRLFQDVFRRAVDSSGLTYWTGLLNRGTSRTTVVRSFLKSTEGRSHIVGDIYLRFLRRYPTTAETPGLISQFLASGELALYFRTVAGNEYFARS